VSIAINNDIICIGGNATVTSTITNGSGSYVYQWQSSPNGIDTWSNTGGNTSSLFLTGTVTGTTYYRVAVDDLANGCNNPLSDNVSLVVQSGPSVTVSVNQDSVCVFSSVELTPNIINGSGLYDYQWQSSTAGAGGPWTNISGANSEIYTPPTSVPGVTWYRVAVTDLASGCGDPVSGASRIAVFAQPQVSIDLPVQVVCVGGVALITSTITNGSGVFGYQWQESADGSSGQITAMEIHQLIVYLLQ
jgi:hypothetical protein